MVNKKTSALFSKEKASYINKIYGKMSCRYVIYLGDSKTVDGIGYLNVEEFINNQNIGYEFGLPEYLQNDLDELKKGLKEKSSVLDCLMDELESSINMAEITDKIITHKHAEYLRKKYC